MAASCAWLGSARLTIHLLLTLTLPVGTKLIAPVEVTVIFVPTMALELILPPVTLPVTDNKVNVPTLVMLACALAVTYCAVPADVALATVPVTLAPVKLVNKLPLPIK